MHYKIPLSIIFSIQRELYYFKFPIKSRGGSRTISWGWLLVKPFKIYLSGQSLYHQRRNDFSHSFMTNVFSYIYANNYAFQLTAEVYTLSSLLSAGAQIQLQDAANACIQSLKHWTRVKTPADSVSITDFKTVIKSMFGIFADMCFYRTFKNVIQDFISQWTELKKSIEI